MADAADDRELMSKSVRPVGPLAIPPRPGEAMRHLADLTYQLKPDRESRPVSASAAASPSQARSIPATSWSSKAVSTPS